MSGLLRSGRTDGREECYSQLLKLAAGLTGANRATFFPLDRDSGTLVGAEDQEVHPIYGEAAREAARIAAPILFQPQKEPSPPILALPIRYRDIFMGVLAIGERPMRPLDEDDLRLVALLAQNPFLVSEKQGVYNGGTIHQLESVQALVRTLEARDQYSGQHSFRVTELSWRFGRHLGLPHLSLKALKTAGYLHDIGKVGVSDAILLKPGPLTSREWEIIEAHPVMGGEIVEPLKLQTEEMEIILYHHERWDGQGYPQGLAGGKIPFLCRLVSLADAFDSLTSNRPYRRRFTLAEALEEIRAHAGGQFDPVLAREFIKMISASAV